jgi:pimeloyl-ACP methyl ester carboxylesterase
MGWSLWMSEVTVNGVRLHYERSGAGEPILFISGTGVGGGIWCRAQVPRFERTHECVVFDLRGAGASAAPPGPYSVRLLAEDTVAFMDALEIESAHLVGLSLGSAILQEIALLHPVRARSAVLISTWSSTAREHHIRRWFEARLLSLREAPRAVFGAYSFWMWAPTIVDQEPALMAELEEFFRQNSGEQPVHAYVSHFEADLGHETLDRLNEIDLPTLVIYGEEDLITLPRYNQTVARLIPGAQEIAIPAAGHFAFVERPDVVNDAIAAFLVEAGDQAIGAAHSV